MAVVTIHVGCDAGTFKLSDGFMAYIRRVTGLNTTFTVESCSFGIILHFTCKMLK